MSCIITYKGQKYSEEQFKEYFINNRQEFATSIAKNKDVIDSFKRKMKGIDYVFSQSPKLANDIEGFKNFVQGKSNSVKLGVKELFDSNPNLANSVYEALGFKQEFNTKGISIKFNDGDWNIILLNNKRIGQFKFIDNGEKGILSLSIQINEDYQNKGYGQIVHIMAADLAEKEYKKSLYSDYQNSEQEVQLLKSLAKKGYAEQTGNIGTESKEFPGTFNTTERAFRIKTPNEINQITTKQKQEAQQKFQEYINATGKQDIQGFKNFIQGKPNSVKLGVEELFESNPELSNAVYEALGFNFRYTSEKWKDDPTKSNEIIVKEELLSS